MEVLHFAFCCAVRVVVFGKLYAELAWVIRPHGTW
jgi:hypothetical protein